jgi:hypothetical protein
LLIFLHLLSEIWRRKIFFHSFVHFISISRTVIFFSCHFIILSLPIHSFLCRAVQEQPLLIQDLLEQEKREQQQQQPTTHMMLGPPQQHQPNSTHHPMMHHEQTTPIGGGGVDPMLRTPMIGGHPSGMMRQYPAAAAGGGGMGGGFMTGVRHMTSWPAPPRHPQVPVLLDV